MGKWEVLIRKKRAETKEFWRCWCWMHWLKKSYWKDFCYENIYCNCI